MEGAQQAGTDGQSDRTCPRASRGDGAQCQHDLGTWQNITFLSFLHKWQTRGTDHYITYQRSHQLEAAEVQPGTGHVPQTSSCAMPQHAGAPAASASVQKDICFKSSTYGFHTKILHTQPFKINLLITNSIHKKNTLKNSMDKLYQWPLQIGRGQLYITADTHKRHQKHTHKRTIDNVTSQRCRRHIGRIANENNSKRELNTKQTSLGKQNEKRRSLLLRTHTNARQPTNTHEA